MPVFYGGSLKFLGTFNNFYGFLICHDGNEYNYPLSCFSIDVTKEEFNTSKRYTVDFNVRVIKANGFVINKITELVIYRSSKTKKKFINVC